MSTKLIQLPPMNLLRPTSVYFVGEILNRLVPFLLIPVLTRYLTPEEYGIVGLFQVVLGIIGPISHLNLAGAVSRFYFERKESITDFPNFIANCMYLSTAGAIVVGLLTLLFANPIGSLSSFPPAWLWSVIVVSFGNSLGLVILGLWQMRQQARPYILFMFLRTLMNFGLAITLVAYYRFNWTGPIIAQVGSMSVFGVLAVYLLARDGWIKLGWNKQYAVLALRFGVPLIPHAIGSLLVALVDRVFLSHACGLAGVGIYTVSYQISMVVLFATDSFNRAWVPWFYEKLTERDPKTLTRIVRATYFYFIAVLIGAVMFGSLIPPALKYFVGAQYAESSRYVLLLAIAFAFHAMYKMVTNYIFFSKRTYLLAYITGAVALFNISLCIWLIPRYELYGAAVATLLSYMASFVVTWIVAAKCYAMPWRVKRVAA